MAQKILAFTASAQTFATVPEHKKMKPRSINIMDVAAGAKVLTFTDVFTTDASNGASATTVTNTWLKVYCPGSGVNIQISKNDLEGIELLGAVKVTSDTADATSYVTLAYDLE